MQQGLLPLHEPGLHAMPQPKKAMQVLESVTHDGKQNQELWSRAGGAMTCDEVKTYLLYHHTMCQMVQHVYETCLQSGGSHFCLDI